MPSFDIFRHFWIVTIDITVISNIKIYEKSNQL